MTSLEKSQKLSTRDGAEQMEPPKKRPLRGKGEKLLWSAESCSSYLLLFNAGATGRNLRRGAAKATTHVAKLGGTRRRPHVLAPSEERGRQG